MEGRRKNDDSSDMSEDTPNNNNLKVGTRGPKNMKRSTQILIKKDSDLDKDL